MAQQTGEAKHTPGWLVELKERTRLSWAILRGRDGNLIAHVKRELRAAGMDDSDAMNAAMARHLTDMVRVFSAEGHSGMSAAYACGALTKLLAFEPLAPLTGEPSEWVEVSDGLFQNIRCGRVFKDMRLLGGAPYDIDAVVFREPNGFCFTNSESRRHIAFPYIPTTEYRAAIAKAQGSAS